MKAIFWNQETLIEKKEKEGKFVALISKSNTIGEDVITVFSFDFLSEIYSFTTTINILELSFSVINIGSEKKHDYEVGIVI